MRWFNSRGVFWVYLCRHRNSHNRKLSFTWTVLLPISKLNTFLEKQIMHFTLNACAETWKKKNTAVLFRAQNSGENSLISFVLNKLLKISRPVHNWMACPNRMTRNSTSHIEVLISFGACENQIVSYHSQKNIQLRFKKSALFNFNVEVLSKLIRPKIVPRLLAFKSKNFLL